MLANTLEDRDNRNRPSTNPKLIEETLRMNDNIARTKSHLLWGFLNVAVAVILILYRLDGSGNDSMMTYAAHQGQLILAAVLVINSCFHFVQYAVKTVTMQPICLSPTQRKLLGISSYDRYFKAPEATPKTTATAGVEPTFTATFPMNLSATSWLSPTALNESTVPSRSVYVASSPISAQAGVPHRPGEEPITDESSLSRFLDAVEEQERRATVGVSVESSPTSLGSFWNSPSPRGTAAAEVSPLLRRCAYQMSSVSAVTPSSSPGTLSDDGSSPASISHAEFWRRVKVDPGRLTQWNANLRMWTSLTIVQRVVAELDHIDAAFVRCGLSDLHLGSVGLDRLKRTACIPQVVASIPSLPRLVPFLELSPHQEYLVTRIRELAKGGSMSEFRWNSGGSLHGKAWEEHLPTDAALVMHLIATYLDLQLVPSSQRPDAPPSRPFSAQHLVRSPERPPTRPHAPVIYQSQLNPPHFILLDKDQVYDVPKGRNNVFYTFLLFLHLLKTREHGMLGPLNLGRSGVNVLWVVDS